VAWLWSDVDLGPGTDSKLSFLLLYKWNLINSTLTLKESLRSPSANGDHVWVCGSLRLAAIKNK